ncbi:TPA: hypothetical protein DDW35_10605 [Candidatus Sumerlaeota bacterium]|nr:hypothetical protein [Candidatus Sumerlaeota bacterium]
MRKGWDEVKKYDLQETLKSVTVLGSLLHKLRGKEDRYMENAAFKLGQLLAAADVVHLGYCEGVRGGQVPPSLLGNQIFNTALNNPEKAFGMLALRWAPYAAWVKEAGHNMAKKTPGEKLSQKEWNIRKALRNAREAGKLTAELTGCFKECKADDAFRAELLLGYMAGIPAAEKESDEE